MKAADFLEVFDKARGGAAVMASSGISGAIWRFGHRRRTLYNTGMAYTAAACMGLAMCQRHMKVIAVEGDGSFLMGLPTIATIGRYLPSNLCVTVFNNRTYLPTGTTGELPSAAAYRADLGGLARAAGIGNVYQCATGPEFAAAMDLALGGTGPSVVVAEVEIPRASWDLDGRGGRLDRAEMASEFRRDLAAGAAASHPRDSTPALDPPKQEEWIRGSPGWRAAAGIYGALRAAGIDFVVYLPDSMLYPLQVMAERDLTMETICCSREDEGAAIASGAALAGRTAALVCEGTGVGMAATALAGLIARRTAILIVSSHPASLGIRRPWDDIAVAVNEPVLRALGVPVTALTSVDAARVVMRESVMDGRMASRPTAVVIPPYVMD